MSNSQDHPKDVAREVPRPDLNSWTENDVPRSKKSRKRPPKDVADPARGKVKDEERRTGTGNPDVEETYRDRQGAK